MVANIRVCLTFDGVAGAVLTVFLGLGDWGPGATTLTLLKQSEFSILLKFVSSPASSEKVTFNK